MGTGCEVWGLNDTNFSVMNQKQRALVRGGCMGYLYSHSKEYYDLRGKGNPWIKLWIISSPCLLVVQGGGRGESVQEIEFVYYSVIYVYSQSTL
jgi:hypothetical protein